VPITRIDKHEKSMQSFHPATPHQLIDENNPEDYLSLNEAKVYYNKI